MLAFRSMRIGMEISIDASALRAPPRAKKSTAIAITWTLPKRRSLPLDILDQNLTVQPFPVQVLTTPPEALRPLAKMAVPRAFRCPSGQVAEMIPFWKVRLKDFTEPLPPAIFGIVATEPVP